MTRYDAQNQQYYQTNPGFGLGVKVFREDYGIDSIPEKPLLDKTYGATGKVSIKSLLETLQTRYWYDKTYDLINSKSVWFR